MCFPCVPEKWLRISYTMYSQIHLDVFKRTYETSVWRVLKRILCGEHSRGFCSFNGCSGHSREVCVELSRGRCHSVLGIPIAPGSIDAADICPHAYQYCLNNHASAIRCYYTSIADMEVGAQCRKRCADGCLRERPPHATSHFAHISPPCQPWSSLSNSETRVKPNEHKLWDAVFGEGGSVISVTKQRLPHVVLFEEVLAFAQVLDSTGRTGLQRLCDELLGHRVGNKRFYAGWASVELCPEAWMDVSRTRL